MADPRVGGKGGGRELSYVRGTKWRAGGWVREGGVPPPHGEENGHQEMLRWLLKHTKNPPVSKSFVTYLGSTWVFSTPDSFRPPKWFLPPIHVLFHILVSPVRSTYGGYYGLVVVTPPRPQTLHPSRHGDVEKTLKWGCFWSMTSILFQRLIDVDKYASKQRWHLDDESTLIRV